MTVKSKKKSFCLKNFMRYFYTTWKQSSKNSQSFQNLLEDYYYPNTVKESKAYKKHFYEEDYSELNDKKMHPFLGLSSKIQKLAGYDSQVTSPRNLVV